MKRVYSAGLITLTMMLSISTWLRAQDDPITASFSDLSRPGLLRVSMMSGTLTVKTHARRDVVIQTRARAARGRRQEAESRGLKRLDAVTTGLSVEEENNVMSINTTRMNSLDVEIQVPVRTNLKLTMINGDDMVIQGVDGDIEVTNNNGNVTLTDVSGSVIAHSQNGRVRATMKRVTAQKPMSFTSLNGNVDVTLPPDTRANLKLRSDNGDVWTDFDIQIKPSAAPVILDLRKNGGPLRISVDRSVLGTINGGGPDFELRTTNGSVFIRKARF